MAHNDLSLQNQISMDFFGKLYNDLTKEQKDNVIQQLAKMV